MFMDKEFMDYCGSLERIVDDERNVSLLSDRDSFGKPKYHYPTVPRSHSGTVYEGDSHDDCDFSDVVFKYINQMLMEEDMEEKTCMFQDSAALQAAERSFHEVLSENPHQSSGVDPNTQSPNDSSCITSCIDITSSSTSSCSVIGPSSDAVHIDYESPSFESVALDLASRVTSQASVSPSTYADTSSDIGLGSVKEPKEDVKISALVKIETSYEAECYSDGSRGQKNPHPDELDIEEGGRSNKQSAIFAEATVRSEMFDMVLLCNGWKSESALRQAFQNGVSKKMQQNDSIKASNGAKTRGKKQQRGKRDVVDLRILLNLCAQAVGGDDRRSAYDLLKQIRQHSSPTGDGMQRLAHYFADGLEARLSGSGTKSYVPVITKPTSAAEVLKAYHLFLSVCPFKKLSNFFANKTIMKVSKKATSLHIIDFGVLYGFQWPCLIQRLSSRPGGPPKLRITGIDLPNSGFRPAARVEETGQRLADYAKSFNVPFEFKAIAQKWETIKIEDLKLDSDEVLVVNCQYRLRNLLDETVVVSESPRDKVLKLIRNMNPDVYLQGVTNGSYNSPFFIARFREALFFYSSVFDMLEVNVPREVNERIILEKQIYGWEVMNVIACEGAERIERPETYKQWQVRNIRVGFKQLPVDRDIMDMAKERVSTCYHKDFVIDKDGDWMLLGWKGRIVHALSSWRAAR